MVVRFPREQISQSYSDNRGRPTRTSQKLDNAVKSALDEQFDAQAEINIDFAQASLDAQTASNQALAASTYATTASNQATAAASSATTASGQATTASSQATAAAGSATTASSNATAAASSATTASSNATAAANSATTASNKATDAANSATAAANSAALAASYALTTVVAVAGTAGTLTGSPSSGFLTAAHGYVDPTHLTTNSYPAALKYCSATPYGAAAFFVSIYAVDASNITFYLSDTSGVAISGGSYTVIWRVAGL